MGCIGSWDCRCKTGFDIGLAGVKALAILDTKLTTAAGICSGVVSWILGNIELFTKLGSLIGALAGALLAVLSLWIRFANWRRRRREERERWPRGCNEPRDVDDDIPLR